MRRTARTKNGSPTTAGARPFRRARAPAGGRDPRSRSDRRLARDWRPSTPGRSQAEWCSSSGLNHALDLRELREQNLHLLAPGVDVVVALILVVLQRDEVPDLVRRAGRSRRTACRPRATGHRALTRRQACPAAPRIPQFVTRARRRRPSIRPSSGKMCARFHLKRSGMASRSRSGGAAAVSAGEKVSIRTIISRTPGRPLRESARATRPAGG